MQKKLLVLVPLIFAVIVSASVINTDTSDAVSGNLPNLQNQNSQLNTVNASDNINTSPQISNNTEISSQSINNTNKTTSNQSKNQNKLEQLKTIIITGIVNRCDNGEPFEGVTITVNSLAGDLLTSTVTGIDGVYKLIFQSTDTEFKVTASYPGHMSKTSNVITTQNTTNSSDSNYYGSALFTLGNLILDIGSWEYIGIDSNKPDTSGPNATQVQLHITNNGNTTYHNLYALFNFTSGTDANITLVQGESKLKYVGDLPPGQTVDVYWLVEGVRNLSAAGQYRNYTVTVSGDDIGANATINNNLTLITMISQKRNSISSISTANTTVHNGDIFTVYINASTSSDKFDQTYLPGVSYDPSVIKPINVSITYTNSSGTYTTNDTNLLSTVTNQYLIAWTYQVIGTGSSIVTTTIEDETNPTNHHYNTNYNATGTYINITSLPSADVGVKTDILPANCPNQSWPPVLGQIMFFQINATNYGPDNATGVTITDMLPSSVTYKDYSLSTDGGTTWTLSKNLTTSVYNATTGVWNVGNLTTNSNKILMIRGTVNKNNTTITNTANKTAQNEYDPNSTNDNATSSVYVPG